MVRTLFPISLCALLLGVGLAPTRASPKEPCVTTRAEARYRNYGYDHLVHLKNGCRHSQICEVSTNVQPKRHRITLEVGEEKTVITMIGSPARAFSPRVSCKPTRG